MTREQIARVCHEVNRAYCECYGDFSQPTWEEAPEWQKDSALAGVDLHLNNTDADASASHEAWVAHKLADGWKYGLIKDSVAKTHPCLMPFYGLPIYQRAKDFIFKAVVHSLRETEKEPA